LCFWKTAPGIVYANSTLARSHVFSCLSTSVMPRGRLLEAERVEISCSSE
jgi:hypothetical protein